MCKIVSVQDISCYGQCSLTVALPILSSYGFETAILPSGILSTHTGGFTDFTYHDLTEEMPLIVNHWKKENITFDAIYTGYIGDARQFNLIKNMRGLLNPGGQLIVDPAMADHGKLYVALDETIVAGMREIVSVADLILPNITEGYLLTGLPYKENPSSEEIDELLKKLAELGPKKIILTGVKKGDKEYGAAFYDSASRERVDYYAELISGSYHGTGDVFASVAIATYLQGKNIYEVLKEACEFVVKSIKATLDDKSHIYGVKFEKVLNEKRLENQ